MIEGFEQIKSWITKENFDITNEFTFDHSSRTEVDYHREEDVLIALCTEHENYICYDFEVKSRMNNSSIDVEEINIDLKGVVFEGLEIALVEHQEQEVCSLIKDVIKVTID